MDRALKEKQRSGFSLIELIVTIVIFAILLSISESGYHQWIKKVRIEEDTNNIFSLINSAKSRAFVQKTLCGVVWQENDNIRSMELRCDSDFDNDIEDEGSSRKINLKYPFASNIVGSSIVFSKNGFTSNGGTVYSSTPSGASYDCIKIHRISIRMGKWNADDSTCELK